MILINFKKVSKKVVSAKYKLPTKLNSTTTTNIFIAILATANLLNLFAVSSAQAEPLVPLKEMVERVISSNPEVQAKYHAYVGAGFEQDVVRGGFLPKVDIQSTYRKQENIDNFRNGNGTAIPRFNNELILRQMIFDGFATPNEVNR